ncbi:MAG: HAD hydrolase family protein [Patescibacteria group bacterium]|nr:HAD hydrolase family protein [Patescibacteria group bacterium]
MRPRLILCDLDMSLIGRDYQPTIQLDAFKLLVRQMMEAGDLFGLNSDTPYEPLRRWMGIFGFTGPIVSEKGAIVSTLSGSHLLTRQQVIGWHSVKQLIISSLRSAFPDFALTEEYYLDLLSNQRGLDARSGTMIVINPFRLCGFGLHVWTNQLTPDYGAYPSVVGTVKVVLDRLGITELVDIDANAECGVLILSSAGLDKELAVPVLRRKYRGYRVIAIGDGRSDARLLGHVDLLCAVSNAAAELQAVADFVATEPITAGALEILQRISTKPLGKRRRA